MRDGRPAKRFRLSLRLRLFVGMFVVALVATLGFAVAMHEFVEVLEEELLHRTLVRELDALAIDYRDDANIAGQRGLDDWVYVSGPATSEAALPRALQDLGAGDYEVIQKAGHEYYAGRRDVGNARIYLLLSVESVEALERRLATIGWLTFTASVLVALLIALFSARLILKPVRSLAARVARLQPTQASPPLAPDYNDEAVEAIARSFDALVERFQLFVERERAFTHDASHELRTPLAVVLSGTELLLADVESNPCTRARAQRIASAGQRMQRLITALLFLAREVSRRVDRCDVTAVLAEVLPAYRAELERRNVALRVETRTSHVTAPPGLVDCLLHNLIENAVEHTVEGHVGIDVDHARIRVSDTGSGIAPEILRNIREYRYHARDRSGLGIGLYLVQRICARLGWELVISSRPGAGSRFEIVFTLNGLAEEAGE